MQFLNLLKSSNKPIFYKFFYNYFYNFFHIYIKMSTTLLVKYYQENKEKLRKKARERYSNLPKEEKEK